MSSDLPRVEYSKTKEKGKKGKVKAKQSDIDEAGRLNRELGERLRKMKEEKREKEMEGVKSVKMSDVLQGNI